MSRSSGLAAEWQVPLAGAPAVRREAIGRATTESLLDDRQYVTLVRWVYTARLVCLALAAPAALTGAEATIMASLSLCLLTVFSLVISRSDTLIRTMIRHPLLASADVAIAVTLLTTIDSRQPAALTVICSALGAGLLFPRRVLLVLMVPLVMGSFGAPAAMLVAAPDDWQGWLSLIAGLPMLVIGVCTIGSVVRHNVQAMIQARHDVSEARAAVGAAEERARLARDMHDSVGKSIYGISLGAKALRRMVDRDPMMARELATSLADSADVAAQEARDLLVSLRDGQVDRPTVDVISELIHTWERETGLRARLSTVHAVDAAPAVTSQMWYALGEILHNVHKHAEATEVEVVLRGGPELIELSVTDNGKGFEPECTLGPEATGHFGLRGLRERAEQVGGEVDITSTTGEGTKVRWTALRHPVPA